MATHGNLRIKQAFSNFWANVSKLTIKESVKEETTDAIKNGLHRANPTTPEKASV